MPKRGRPKKVIEVPSEVSQEKVKVQSEKEKLLELYSTLKDLGINSIGDLENRIANAR